MTNPDKYYVLFDGDCGFCNFWVKWILQRDLKNQFLFASLQSNLGQNFLNERGLDFQNFNSIILWKPNEYFLLKSDAIAQIAKVLGGKYYIFSYIRYLPVFIRDGIYNIIAQNRKKINPTICTIPTDEERKKIVY